MALRVLVMGGTQFAGRHFVDLALARGHHVTIFHRGVSGPNLFPNANHVLGDRDTDISGLVSGEWDATVDFSAYFPRHVRQLHALLGTRAGTYTCVSTVAAYDIPWEYGLREDHPLFVPDDQSSEVLNDDTYGGLKALCEIAARETFGECLVVRPTYIVGPYDYTGRFTWWMNRVAQGGVMLAPGPAEAHFQLIDVRDLAHWVLGMVERHVVGVYNAATPFPPATFGQVLNEMVSLVGPRDMELVWVDKTFLLERGISQAILPMWPGGNPDGLIEAVDPSSGIEVGLTPRSLAATILELREHELREPTPVLDPKWSYPGSASDVGLKPDVEARLLQEWRDSKR